MTKNLDDLTEPIIVTNNSQPYIKSLINWWTYTWYKVPLPRPLNNEPQGTVLTPPVFRHKLLNQGILSLTNKTE